MKDSPFWTFKKPSVVTVFPQQLSRWCGMTNVDLFGTIEAMIALII